MTAALTRRAALARTSLTALFAALIACGAVVTIPLPFSPVPVTIQNLFAVLSGLALGPVFGAAAVGLYLAAGAAGAPVFAGAAGGFVHFASPSGGFLAGYLIAAALSGLIAGRPRPGRRTPLWRAALAAFAGFAILYVPGLLQLKLILAADWPQTLALGLLPFIPGDIAKLVVASLAAPRLRAAVAAIE